MNFVNVRINGTEFEVEERGLRSLFGAVSAASLAPKSSANKAAPKGKPAKKAKKPASKGSKKLAQHGAMPREGSRAWKVLATLTEGLTSTADIAKKLGEKPIAVSQALQVLKGYGLVDSPTRGQYVRTNGAATSSPVAQA